MKTVLRRGTLLSDAMAKHPKAFDRLYCKMIAAGEVGGVLDLILQRLAEFMEKAAKLKARIIGAMIYPAVVLSVAGLIVTAIMIFIVPQFEKIFDDFNTDLPMLTLYLMNAARWLGGSLYPHPDNPRPGLGHLLARSVLVHSPESQRYQEEPPWARNIVDRRHAPYPWPGS